VLIVLGVPIEKINVVSHFLGGGFGGKAYVWPHTLLTALAARARPAMKRGRRRESNREHTAES
jgi:CO/xanthine dehydrogenase Mo-binding subunit